MIVKSTEESKQLARVLAASLNLYDVIAFIGDLGAGKSFFCREIIKFFCGKDTIVVSPTFNLLQTYQFTSGTIYHYDLHRLEHISELYELGFEDAFNNITLIEWPQIATEVLPLHTIFITIDIIDDTTREITITSGK